MTNLPPIYYPRDGICYLPARHRIATSSDNRQISPSIHKYAPVPSLRYEPSGLWVGFSYPAIQMASRAMEAVGSVEVTTQKTTQKSSVESSVESSVKTPARILQMIRRNPGVAVAVIAEELGLTSRAIEKQVRQLKATGHLRRIGPTKGGHWEILK